MKTRNRDELAAHFKKSSELLEVVEGLTNKDNWFQLIKSLVRVMGIKEAVMFCLLRNHAQKHIHDKDGYGWFYCTTNQIKDAIGLHPRAQDRIMKKLRDMKYIRTKWQTGKVPAVRLININWHVMAADIYLDQQKEIEKASRPSKRKSREQLLNEMEENEGVDDFILRLRRAD